MTENVYVGPIGAEPSGPLPRYITVTPDEGAIITIAVPWPQIEATVKAAGYEIVPVPPAADPPTTIVTPHCTCMAYEGVYPHKGWCWLVKAGFAVEGDRMPPAADHDCLMPSACGVTGFYCSNSRPPAADPILEPCSHCGGSGCAVCFGTGQTAADQRAVTLDVERTTNDLLMSVNLVDAAIHHAGMVLVDQVSGKPVDDGPGVMLRYLARLHSSEKASDQRRQMLEATEAERRRQADANEPERRP